MIGRKSVILSVSVIGILVLSLVLVGFSGTPKAVAQAKVPGANWEYINNDKQASNFNPQTQINKDNVHLLELKWLFPIPSASVLAPKNIGFATVQDEGSRVPPPVVDGIVYVLTGSRATIAIDAKTGKNIWTYSPTYNDTEARARLPVGAASHGSGHAMYYFEGKLWINDFGCKVTALDALTGKIAKQYKDLCLNVPTNTGIYASSGSHPPVFYQKDRTMIWAVGGQSEGTGGGRMFVAGYDIDTGARKWITFLQPPEGAKFPQEKKAWGDALVSNCKKGWIEGIPACDVPADILRNDWGDMRFNSGLSNVWGQMAVDEDAGIVYLGTAQPGPDWNATYTPGPRQFGSSIIALDARTGEMKWFYQSSARDLWDMDCSWGTILGNIGNRKVVFKGCKVGRVHALDAATGQPIWVTELPSVRYSQYFCNAKCDNNRPQGAGQLDINNLGRYAFLDPRNREDMNKPWQNYPAKAPFFQNPTGSGAIEMDMAFAYGKIFAGVKNDPSYQEITPVEGRFQFGQRGLPAPVTPENNSTITALDAATGRILWNFFIPKVPYRGGTFASGGVLYVNGWDGNLYGLDVDTGKALLTKYVGSGLDVQPTMGATTDGKMQLFLLFGGRAIPGRTAIPGALMAYGLPDKIPEPQVVTKEVVKEVVKEVIKEVPKEVVKEVPKEVIKEVVKEVPKEVTKTVTVETISPITYVGLGVAVIIAVVSVVVAMRSRKPAT